LTRFYFFSFKTLLFIIIVKRELKRVYRNGCRYNERLNAETGGSKTPRTHKTLVYFYFSLFFFEVDAHVDHYERFACRELEALPYWYIFIASVMCESVDQLVDFPLGLFVPVSLESSVNLNIYSSPSSADLHATSATKA